MTLFMRGLFYRKRDNSFMRIEMPSDVKFIIETLEQAGYEAYAVGGCIRDSILQRVPDDWDITTSAKPEQIKKLFMKTIDTGIAHGTVTVMKNHTGYEVTTYRIDGEYEDGRHPKEVTFTSDLLEDLRRRDFTINAMAYNDRAGLVDAFGGREDIQKQRIRCVGEAKCRFSEDALRMMRAVRFAAQLGYEIEEETKQAISLLAKNLEKISAERIRVELMKLLLSDHPYKLREMYELGLTAVFFPEFDKAMITTQNNPHHIYTVGEHILKAVELAPKDSILRLTMLLHDIAKPETLKKDEEGIDHFHGHNVRGEIMAVDILRRLRFDNLTIGQVGRLVNCHDDKVSLKPERLRKYISKLGCELFEALLKVKEADMLAQSLYLRKEKEEELKRLGEEYEKICISQDCLSLKELELTGNDLIMLGMKPGKEIGDMLQQVLEHVLENPENNKKDILLQLVKNKIEV